MKQPFYTKEIWCSRKRDNSPSSEVYRIYGKVYIPATSAADKTDAADAADTAGAADTTGAANATDATEEPGSSEGRYPLVIFSHELGKNHEAGVPYAERLAAAGYAVYTFDYCGGTVFFNREGDEVRQRHSSGETTEASLLTWTDDLTSVFQTARTWDFVDPDHIYLMGGSQGAVSSVLTACRNQKMISEISAEEGFLQKDGAAAAGVILMYPPLDLPERMHRLFRSKNRIPERFDLFDGWIQLGRRYAEDIWDLNVYQELAGYRGRTLILHGDKDDIVDLSVSERSVSRMQNCDYYRIPGGRHGFKGAAFEEACGRILDFLETGSLKK